MKEKTKQLLIELAKEIVKLLVIIFK